MDRVGTRWLTRTPSNILNYSFNVFLFNASLRPRTNIAKRTIYFIVIFLLKFKRIGQNSKT